MISGGETTCVRLRSAVACAILSAVACVFAGSPQAVVAREDAGEAPSAPAAAASASASLAPAQAPAELTPFDIWEYQVEDNTVLDIETIERAVTPQLGPHRDMNAVEAARSALEAAYQKAGFLTVLVDVPEQRVDNGVVRLRVIEGSIDRLYVKGSRYHSQGYIRAQVPELQPGKVPDFNQVQRELASVNRSDDRRVQPVLRPGKLPGTVEVDLQVDDKLPLSGNIEINNQHAHDTTPTRVAATLRYDNLFQRDHSLALTAQVAPQKPSESRVLVANYLIPLEGADAWSVSGVFSNSDLATLGGTQVLGKGATLGLRRSIGFGPPEAGQTLSLGADFKDLKERTLFGTQEIATPLRYLPFHLAYTGYGSAGAQRWQANADFSFAARELFARQVPCPLASGETGFDDQFNCKRSGADGSFAVLRLDGRWSYGWQAASLGARLGAQLATGPLVNAEQYALGGADTVRGYEESEVSGDLGWLGSIELRSANFGPRLGSRWTDLTLLSFVDAARAYVVQALPGQAPQASLLALGVGLRLTLRPGIDGTLDLAWPQKATLDTPAGSLRANARLVARF
jgi:hemolysin activation/secretion protein